MRKLALVTALTIFMTVSAKAQDSVEVLHWWTSGGEAAALNVLKDDLAKKGVQWNDMPVAGGGGEQAMTTARARVQSGNAPTAVQALGFDIIDWAKLGHLANLNAVAKRDGWNNVVPAAIQRFSKHNGTWIAAPVNVHSTNWVWANKAIFDKLDIKQPKSWDELITALTKIQRAGYIPVAHGGQDWQDATVFEAIVLATGGPDFYKKALNDLDDAALRSATMRKAFDRLLVIRSFVDDNFSGRDWNLATAMVKGGKAGVQFMGDWAKGEFINDKLVPNKDFLCFRFPGTQGSVTFNSDQFIMFDSDNRAAQEKLASAILSPTFQIAFNVVKGSVPARSDISDAKFDGCAKKAMKDLKTANKNGNLYGSIAHGHGGPTAVKKAFLDVVTAVFNRQLDAASAPDELADAINVAK